MVMGEREHGGVSDGQPAVILDERQGVPVARKRLRDGARRVPELADTRRGVRQRRGVDHAPDEVEELDRRAHRQRPERARLRLQQVDPASATRRSPHSSAICLAVAD